MCLPLCLWLCRELFMIQKGFITAYINVCVSLCDLKSPLLFSLQMSFWFNYTAPLDSSYSLLWSCLCISPCLTLTLTHLLGSRTNHHWVCVRTRAAICSFSLILLMLSVCFTNRFLPILPPTFIDPSWKKPLTVSLFSLQERHSIGYLCKT